MRRRKGKRMIRIGSAVLAVVLVIAMVIGLLPSGQKALAATWAADLNTTTKYTESLGDNASTEYAGRIWSDKSVFSGDATFELFGGGTATIENDSDFLVAYSTLATSQAIQGQTQAPIDVWFIIDISGSMSNQSSNMDNGYSRIYNAVQALNTSMQDVLDLNPYTRVGVVAFSSTATTLLPLGRYTNSTSIEEVRENGEWVEKEVTVDYFSLSRNTGSRNGATLYTRAVDSNGNRISKDIGVTGGTNIQTGLYEAMKFLAEEEETTAVINGTTIKRVPSVVVLSDGAPTYSSDSASWWSPSNNNNDGPGDSAYPGNGMKVMMVASYMKAAIDRNYGVAGTSSATTLYTIGMGITNLTGEQQDLAYVTLNPAENWNNTNDMATAIRTAWETYYANGAYTGTPDVAVNSGMQWQSSGSSGGGPGGYGNGEWVEVPEYYTFTHPAEYDVTSISNYVDQYYDADNATAVTDVFEQIVANISISAPQVPTEIKGDDPINDGYITYTDPIGEYMEVKDVKAILYDGEEFTRKTKEVSADGRMTTYTFTGEVHSEIYGEQDISSIKIIVTQDAAGNETITVRIPAAVIPVRLNTVLLNADGTVKSHTNNGAYPARVLYTVGLKEEIKNGNIVKTELISEEYKAANSNDDGTINFYSNLYTGENIVNGRTAGNTTVEFEPSHTNPFYYILEDMAIYTDYEGTIQASADTPIDDNQTYYYKSEYYHGNSVETEHVARTGAQLKKTDLISVGGYWYRAAGSPRLNRILEFEGKKNNNSTNTAEDFYAPTFEYAENNVNAYDGKFVVYLGNNGVLTAAASGNLEITKTVTAAEGLVAPDKEFEFVADFNGNAALEGTYVYEIKDATGTIVGTGTVTDGGTIKLKNGQTAKIKDLPPETTYLVTEKAVAGFTTQATGVSGTIVAGKTKQASFVNTYSVETLAFPTSGGVGGTKTLIGRPGNVWTDADSYTFIITTANNAPLPQSTTVTVTSQNADAAGKAAFDFGQIKYTKPGTYYYTIAEMDPEKPEDYLPGISYSQAVYEIVVTVVDDGAGKLTASSVMTKVIDADGNTVNETIADSNAEFINEYNAESVSWGPVASKVYTDNSGLKPLLDGMFTFEMTPNAETMDAPMPLGTDGNEVDKITVTNIGDQVHFDRIIFTQEDAGKVYKYDLKEVIPSESVNGMSYDTNIYTVTVTVKDDATKGEIVAEAAYPDGASSVTFYNSYTPEAVTLQGTTALWGSKTLAGRDMKSGETFEFVLEPANSDTDWAINNGVISYGTDDADESSVSGGQDGVEEKFTFGAITFTKPGTYTFHIKEIAGNQKGVTYDSHICTVTVIVTDVDGRLKAEVTYDNGAWAADNEKAVFVNTYTAIFDTETAVDLYGIKNLTGQTLEEGEFYFIVEDITNQTSFLVTSSASNTLTEGAYTGHITFMENVTYTKAGTYQYQIREQIPATSNNGMTYDTEVYMYTVVVKDDLDGRLYVDSKTLEVSADNGVSYKAATEIAFDNKYVPNPTNRLIPTMTKILEGNRNTGLSENEFQFELSIVSADPDGGVILPNTTIVGNTAEGEIIFDAVTFTAAGTYTFRIKEVIPDTKAGGITYSTQELFATFKVTDDQNGKLTVTMVQTTGGYTITNTYEAVGTLGLKVEKEFTGRANDEWLDTDVFAFEMLVLDPATQEAIDAGEVILPGNAAEIKITAGDADKKADFDNITFKRAGTYKFVIREKAEGIEGVHYDSNPREIVVTATDNGNGTITTTYLISDGRDLIFRNEYDTDSTNLSGHNNLVVEKIFTGRENDIWLDTDKFTFTLAAGDDFTKNAVTEGNVVFASTTLEISNANKAYAHFGDITFKEAGNYTFTVTEESSNILGVTDDENNVRTIYVSVSDNGNGTLTVALNRTSDVLKFVNTYEAKEEILEGRTYLEVTKEFVGREWLDSDVFTFTLAPTGEITTNAVNSGVVKLPDENVISIGKADAGKNAFGDITFYEPGTYSFTIKETKGSLKNVTYDTHTTTIIVTVADNGKGQLVVTVPPTYEGTMVFKNVYTPDPVTAILEGQKELKNRDITANDHFRFHIEAAASSPEGTPMPANRTVANNGNTITFGEIKFVRAGTYTYTITEIWGTATGITYDTETVTATVVVSYNSGNGKLNIEDIRYQKSNSDAGFVFTNIYEPIATTHKPVTIHKELTGNRAQGLRADEFRFEISVLDANPSDGIQLPAETVIGNDADGTVMFDEITFTKPGTYTVGIKEVIPADKAGIVFDERILSYTYKVSDDLNGHLIVTLIDSTDTDNTFTNEYRPEGKLQLTVEKVFTGREENEWLSTDKFAFEILVLDEATQAAINAGEIILPADAAGIEITASDGEKKADFGHIILKKEGTYQFIVREKTGSIAGVTYDSNPREVVVVATDDGVGNITVQYAIAENRTLTFINKYDTESTSLSGHDNLVIVKEFTGRENNVWLDTDKFTFKLTGADTATLLAMENGEVELLSDTLVVDNSNKTYPHFRNIIFHEPGTYKFAVTEVDGGIGGITYDTTPRYVIVNVVDNGDMTMTATVDEASDKLEFKNTYDFERVSLPGETYLKVTKRLSGRDWFDNDEFAFILKAYGENTTKAVLNGAVLLPVNEIVITKADANGTVPTERSVAFEDIVFKEAGTYAFTISEQVPVNKTDGITYDSHEATIVVTIADNNQGSLIVSGVTYNGSMTYENTFTPTEVTATLAGTKVITGREFMDTDEFTFVLSAAEDSEADTPMPAVTRVTISPEEGYSSSISFGSVKYKTAGTYKYVITEVNEEGTIPGISYDKGTVTATVEVTYDPATGLLSSKVTYQKNGGEKEDNFTFTNVYSANASDSVDFMANKTVTPTEGNSFLMAGGEFTFELTKGTTNPSGDPITAGKVSNDAEGNVIFAEDVSYSEPGTYVYEIRELTGTYPGIKYDDSVYVITVVVKDDVSLAKLQTEITITKDGNDVSEINFENEYEPLGTTAILEGTKKLDGHKSLEADEFTFELVGVDNAPMPEAGGEVTTNDASGIFRFGSIEYVREGIFEYIIREKNDGKRGYTYDPTEYTVTVEVRNVNNSLQATANMNAEEVVFQNNYVPDKTVPVIFSGIKILDGRTLQAEEFAFELYDSEGQLVDEAVNNGEGYFEFSGITFDKAETRTYTIVEKNTNVAGVTYDNKSYAVVVEITDMGGYLNAEITYLQDNEEVTVVEFVNHYKFVDGATTTVQFSATKKLTGRTLQAEEFTFVLEDETGKKLYAKNDGNGAIVFETITYTTPGTYIYTISEEEGNIENVTYDENVYTVTVTVEDDLQGGLKATIRDNGEELVFVNTYSAGSPTTDGSEPVIPMVMIMLAVLGGAIAMLGRCGYVKK